MEQKKSAPNYKVRRMRPADVLQVLDIWAQNDLHEGVGTIQSFMTADPDGFIVAAEIKDQNKSIVHTEKRILGMCAGVLIHPEIAFIGLYAVRPELHGLGIGSAMWSKMLEHVGNNNAALYSVEEHLKMYRDRAGFKNFDERKLLIFESGRDEKVNVDILVRSIRGIRCYPLDEKFYSSVTEYDQNIHGYSRAKLMSAVFNEIASCCFVAYDVDGLENAGAGLEQPCPERIRGYGCIRKNNIGKAMIGPVYAANDAVAELLMRQLFESFTGPLSNGLLYMTLDTNPGGERIAQKLNLAKQHELPRIFLRQPYSGAQWNHVYCIHSPNFALL